MRVEMRVEPSDEFVKQVHTMSDKQLLAAYKQYSKKYDVLEAERMKCWKRFMKIQEIQDVLGPKMKAVATIAVYQRKLRIK
jgi:hypothetical protein